MPVGERASYRILTFCMTIPLVVGVLLTAEVVVDLDRLESCQRESLPCQAVWSGL
jgi:hypothetical protein